jgi:hypothetical protein
MGGITAYLAKSLPIGKCIPCKIHPNKHAYSYYVKIIKAEKQGSQKNWPLNFHRLTIKGLLCRFFIAL